MSTKTSTALELTKPSSHPIFLKGAFLIEGQLPPLDDRLYTFRPCASAIMTPGFQTIEEAEIEIRVSMHCRLDALPLIENMYFLSGRFLPLNEKSTPTLYYNIESVVHLSPKEHYIGNPHSNAFATAFGIVTKREMITEAQFSGKSTVCCTVQHGDYDPMNTAMRNFTALYLCRPAPNLLRAQALFQVGREVVLDCSILGFDVKQQCFVFNVLSVSLSSGTMPNHVSGQGPGSPSKNGRKRIRLDAETSDPSPGPSTEPHVHARTDSAKGKEKAAPSVKGKERAN